MTLWLDGRSGAVTVNAVDERRPQVAPRDSGLTVHLLGVPRLDRPGHDSYRFRSRKSWALLTYLVLAERPPSRSHLASLLFDNADDPLGALRWCLAEVRRGLGTDGSVDGDPVELQVSGGVFVDATVVAHGAWVDAATVPGLGEELLENIEIRGAPVFGSWLISARHRLAAASEWILHEAALGAMSTGDIGRARELILRAVTLSPLDENHQALLIRLYRLGGDSDGAAQQYDAFRAQLAELGITPGPAVETAFRSRPADPALATDDTSIEAFTESGTAAIAAGAGETGLQSLRTAVHLADLADNDHLRVHTRLVLSEALVHSLGGLDEEGLATLHEADRIATAVGDTVAMAEVRAELGYVDVLRARYDRAELRLTDALMLARGSLPILTKSTIYLGTAASDRADYARAVRLLREAERFAEKAGDTRRRAYAQSMLARVSLLRGDLDDAATVLHGALKLAEDDHWLAFLPWPQALLGAVRLAQGELDLADAVLQQAYARACQLGDPCWEGIAARGMAGVAEARGEAQRAFELLAEARSRCNRLNDPYVWLDVHILDAACQLGLRHDHPDTPAWVSRMREMAARTGMRELSVRALVHSAALGNPADAQAAELLAAHIDNPLVELLARPLT